MERGNVLVIGNSGVGKSTLINAVLGEERAKKGFGDVGTTGHLEIYESNKIPFRVIDTIGFEPSFFKKMQAINAVKKWSKDSTKADNDNRQINVIWFCVEGTSSKLFPDAIKSLSSATSMWKSVPVIVVITKSYSKPEREQNINMVNNAFAKQKRYSNNLRGVIPVVAETYVLDDTSCAPPEGITELIEATNKLMPEGIKAAEKDIHDFTLHRKKALAQGVVGVSTTAGTVVGAVPIPFPDAAILAPIELAEIKSIAQIYEINKDEKSNQFFKSIVEVGTVGLTAKTVINGVKAIPGVNLAAAALNAIIAGCFVAAIGEGTIYAFEQIYLGNKTIDDIDWVKKVIEAKLSKDLTVKIQKAIEAFQKNPNKKDIAKIILDIVKK